MKIYKMNDCDWIAAENLDEAKLCLAVLIDRGVVDAKFEEEYLDDPYEISEEQWDKLKFVDEDDPKDVRSFREELQRMMDKGTKFPAFFASTEY